MTKLGWLFVAILAACGGEEEPVVSTRGQRGRGPEFSAPVAQVETTESARPTSSTSRSRPSPSRPPAPSGAPSPAAPSEESGPSNADLSALLARAFGTPTSCITSETRERLRDRLTMQVQVSVTPTGIVTRANVSSPQLSAEDLECMRAHAERLRIPGPIPDAPRSITTSVEYAVASGRVEAAAEEATAAEPQRPPGFVPPARTLPASVD